MLRCIAWPEPGTVAVEGGAEYVMLPRLPNELPPPKRASASPGESASARAAMAAISVDVRRIMDSLQCEGA